MNYIIPAWAIEDLKFYVFEGRPLSSFLEAVVSNDFQLSFERADDYNTSIMFQYAHYVHNKMPMGCHGSKKIYEEWCKSRGQKGHAEERAKQLAERDNQRSKVSEQ